MDLPRHFQQNKSLADLTTFGIGGPALYFAEVRSIEEMQKTLSFSSREQIPTLILGKGSNSLFDDRGFNGLVILNKIDYCERPSEDIVKVGAGYSFSLLGSQTARQGWSGLEFASGIPASVGGAIFMNAGANGSETCQPLIAVNFVTSEGQLVHLKKEEMTFTYRHSSFQSMPGAIVGGTFALTPSPEARSKQINIIDYRKKTQPLNAMSAGCIFRNPNCGHAGALIEQSGLKGYQLGGAKVSEIHANFIINTGTATAREVLELIEHVKKTVKERAGVDLAPEVRFVKYEAREKDEG